jgi:uncharacterized metal-binding protein
LKTGNVMADRNTHQRVVCILACSGGNNLGQTCNQAAQELAEEGFGEVICACAIGARTPWAVERVRRADAVVALNGCDARCVSRILRDVGRADFSTVVAGDLAIDKSPGFFTHTYEVEKVKEAARRALVEA